MSFEEGDNPNQYRAMATGSWRLHSAIETGEKTPGGSSIPLVVEEKVIIPEGDSLAARRIRDGKYLWRVPLTQIVFPWIRGRNSCIYAAIDQYIHVIDEDTGIVLRRFSDPECHLQAYSSDVFFSELADRELSAFSLESGEKLWTFRAPQYINYALSGNDYVVLDCGAGWKGEERTLIVLRQSNGAEMSRYEAEALRRDLDIPLIGNNKLDWKLLCCVSGHVLLSYRDGVLLKLSLSDFKVKWAAALSWRHSVETAVEYQGRLYINFDQGFSSINKLICLDWTTGDEVWRMDEDFTPAGIKNPIMVGKYYIGGAFHHAAAYDVETREFTWRYQDKASRFGAGFWAVGEWLISRDLVPTNKLHVFCVDPSHRQDGES